MVGFVVGTRVNDAVSVIWLHVSVIVRVGKTLV